MSARSVFVTGATGYMGVRLARVLLERGHTVRSVARRTSENDIPESVRARCGGRAGGLQLPGAREAGGTHSSIRLGGASESGVATDVAGDARRIAERVGRFREGALRLGLVTIQQMVGALVYGVENPPAVCEILAVPAIRTRLLPSSSRPRGGA